MGFIGQPQQNGPYRSENTFVKGLLTDAAPDATPNTVLTSARNVHVLRQQGSELILATEPGMQRSCLLPPAHVVHGSAERDGVLYLLLAEVDPVTQQATGRGQLGTFPSPDYQYKDPADPTSELVTSGILTDHYRPLRVYYGDHNGQQPTDFISLGFNLALDSPSELELQDSYDGTLNLIVNDRARNPALLINSGFLVLSGNRYELVLRQGQAQTNRYTRADFASRLRLHPKGGTLGRARLLSVNEGGKLRGGEYTYYFTYCDADDNETPIFAEVGPVFVGLSFETPASSQGTRSGEAGLLKVNLALSNLDATLGFVRVSYSWRSGEPSAVGLAYQLSDKLRVNADGTLLFSHTGYADEASLSIEQLQHASGSVSAFATMCQAGNRLLLADTRVEARDDQALVAFARATKLGHEQLALEQVSGLDTGATAGSTLYQSFSQQLFTAAPGTLTPYEYSRASWVGGYVNPLNCTYRLGYMAGESYPFAVRFVLDDYSLTESYPLRAIDNLSGAYPEPNYYNDANPTFYGSDGWATGAGIAARVQNLNGVYRFPLERSTLGGGLGALQPLVPGTGSSVQVLGVRVTLPEIPAELRQRCVGVQFMRAARRPNAVMQGYVVPTLRALATSPGDVYDHAHPDFKAIYQTGSTANLKVLPAVRGTLETVVQAYGKDKDVVQVTPFVFNRTVEYAGLGKVQTFDGTRLALYAPDALLRPTAYLPQLNERELQVRFLSQVQARAAVRYNNPAGSNRTGGSWSLWKTTSHSALGSSQPAGLYPATGFWTLDNQPAVNRGKFGSQERQLSSVNAGVHQDRYLVGLSYDPYVGLNFAAGFGGVAMLDGFKLNSGPSGFEAGSILDQVLRDPSSTTALLVNVYNQGGILTEAQLREVYPLESLSYQPISERLSWQQLEEQLDADRRLVLFGGDTFVGVTYRRVNRALEKEARLDEKFDAPVGQVLSLVCETSVNPYLRATEVSSVNASSGASFLPLLGTAKQDFNAYRESETMSQAESTRYNAGYVPPGAGSLPLVLSSPRLPSVPFRAQRFAARVWASSVSVSGSFSNGYRFLPALSFRDYDRSLGRIIRLLPVGSNQVLVVHEFGQELLGLSEQTLTGQNTGGPVYAEAVNFLPAQGRIISRELGIQHPFAVCLTPKGVYGVDAKRQCIWFWPLGGGEGSVKRISDFAVSTPLRPLLKAYQNKAVDLLRLDVRAVYDPERADVVFSLYQQTLAN